MPYKVILLCGFICVPFILFGLFVCFQILDLLGFAEKPLEGSDCFFGCLLRRVMERLMFIMVRTPIDAEIPADDVSEGDTLRLDMILVEEPFAIVLDSKCLV